MNIVQTLKRKWRTLAADPVCVLRKKRQELEGRFRAFVPYEERFKRSGVLDLIREFTSHRPKDAIPPDFNDLWFLYSWARKKKPRIMLEFGSGVSTVVLVAAGKQNGNNGVVYSVDASRDWAQFTDVSMPRSLANHHKISYSPLRTDIYHGVLTFRHEQIPDVIPNFVYLDGPALTPEVQVASDVLLLEPKFPRGFYMIIDGRIRNMEFLREHLQRKYRFEYRSDYFNSIFELLR